MKSDTRDDDRDAAEEAIRAELVTGERQLPIATTNPHAITQAPASAMAIAIQQQAIVRARFEVAFMRPRSEATVRVALLEDLKRPAFTEKARYKIPNRGEGWTIRWAERTMQLMGNMHPMMHIIHDDDRKLILYVEVIDLERNASAPVEIVIPKTVERKEPPPGVTILAQRRNSYGDMVSIIPATPEEMDTKRAQYASKAIRTCIERLVPPNIKEDCLVQYRETKAAMDKKVAEDPGVELKRIIDGLATLRIKPDEIERYLGHGVDSITTPEIIQLREAYGAVRAGEVRWVDLRREAEEERAEAAGKGKRAASPKAGVRNLEELKARKRPASTVEPIDVEPGRTEIVEADPNHPGSSSSLKLIHGKGCPMATDERAKGCTCGAVQLAQDHARNCGIHVPSIGECTCRE